MYGPDELAGVVDLFGALSRKELVEALSELSFRRGEEFDRAGASAAIDEAVATFHLVPYGSPSRLAAGPAAFPTLPDRAEDLPHVVDVERRSPDREQVAEAARERLRTAVDDAAEVDDRTRLRELREVSYDLATWGPVGVEPIRERIDGYL